MGEPGARRSVRAAACDSRDIPSHCLLRTPTARVSGAVAVATRTQGSIVTGAQARGPIAGLTLPVLLHRRPDLGTKNLGGSTAGQRACDGAIISFLSHQQLTATSTTSNDGVITRSGLSSAHGYPGSLRTPPTDSGSTSWPRCREGRSTHGAAPVFRSSTAALTRCRTEGTSPHPVASVGVGPERHHESPATARRTPENPITTEPRHAHAQASSQYYRPHAISSAHAARSEIAGLGCRS